MAKAFWTATWMLLCWMAARVEAAPPVTVFETTSAYHNIIVYDQDGIRVLSFDGSMETKMSLRYPLRGHFEYTEFFHVPWIWNNQMTNILMIGLGGGSTQRSYSHYYPYLTVETVEIDPMVVQVASNYFHFKESPRQKVHVSDGRVFLRRTEKIYGAILMDAYVENRYGSSIPYHLATKEFFELAARHLPTNGVLCYNIIGTMDGWKADLVGAIYTTLKTVFPQVYFFPARESRNVVVVATRSPEPMVSATLYARATALINSRRITLDTFRNRLYSFRTAPPANHLRSPLLTDDFAPVDGLLRVGE
ncbi:MAG: fused MFS/spermidine synthase [Verrucomicrobia subdivision 3 bacterium]|nr:fused MFS/spermidine synthase [Limisphaerales bacterium]